MANKSGPLAVAAPAEHQRQRKRKAKADKHKQVTGFVRLHGLENTAKGQVNVGKLIDGKHIVLEPSGEPLLAGLLKVGNVGKQTSKALGPMFDAPRNGAESPLERI